MKSRAFFFTLTTIIAIALLAGVIYIWKNIRSEFSQQATVQEQEIIHINKTIQGKIIKRMASANIIVIKDTVGQGVNVAIVSQTRITDEKNTPINFDDVKEGFTVEVKGNLFAPDAMIANNIHITTAPEIVIVAPTENNPITSPVAIEGMAKGTWYFEAVFPVEILDANHQSLGKKFVTATKDWMSESLVPFKGELEFQKPTTKKGYLLFKNDNPSGLKENEKKFEMPITFMPTTMSVNVFFNNSKLDPAFLCEKVFPVIREIPWTEGMARATIEELLKGTNETERSMNYFTNINPNVRINDITIDNGTAHVDFSEELGKNIAGSCRVTAIRSQIEETLKQFPTVNNVVLSINGVVNDILQP